MRKVGMVRALALVASFGCVVAVAVATTAMAGPEGGDNGVRCIFNTQLTPEAEVRPPGTTDPVTSTAQGHAQVKIRNDGRIEFNVFILNKAGELFRVGHIHRGDVTVAGPVVVHFLGGPAGGTASTDEQIRVTGVGVEQQPAAGLDVASEICNNPTNFYVNFHTADDPQGAVRGQLG
jgi:CHRD domain